MSIQLKVSLGEAIDKLTILDIKKNKILDNRKLCIIEEYNYLCKELENYISKYNYYYKMLYNVNLKIWNLMDIVREDNKKFNFSELCAETIHLNDARFLVKKKINELCNSTFKEQKGYKLRILNIVLDINNEILNDLNAAIRYYSFFYDEIYLFVDISIINNIIQKYEDDPFIKIKNISDEINNEYDFIKINNIDKQKKNIRIITHFNHSFFVNKSINDIFTFTDINDFYAKINLDKKICDDYKN